MSERQILGFDEALEAYNLGEDVEFSLSVTTSTHTPWKPVFQKSKDHPDHVLVAKRAFDAYAQFRLKPPPRCEEIMKEMFEQEAQGTGRKNWRSTRGAKKAVREALARVKELACNGPGLNGTKGVDKIRAIEAEFCGLDEC